MTGRRTPAIVLAMAVSGAFLIFFWGEQINGDTAWYLLATEKWLAGDRLYLDIIEVNPPWTFYLTSFAAGLAKIVPIGLVNAQFAMVAALLLLNLLWASNLLDELDYLSAPRRVALLLATAVALVIPALADIADREHLLVLFITPWILGYLTTSDPEGGGWPVARAAFAAIGICIKPHFVLYPVAVTLWRICRVRSLHPVLSPSNLVIFAIALLYLLQAIAFHSAYFTAIAPSAFLVYGFFGFGDAVVVSRFLAAAFVPLALIAFLMSRTTVPKLGLFMALLSSGAVSYLLQWKGFSNHLIPLVSSAVLLCAWVLVHVPLRSVAAFLSYASLLIILSAPMAQGIYRNPLVSRFAPLLETYGPQPRFAALSTSLRPGPPVALGTGAVWTSRYPALWYIPGALAGLEGTDCEREAGTCGKLHDLLRKTREDVVEDLTTQRPHVLIVDKQPVFVRQPGFSWIDFLSTDDRFAKALGDYQLREEDEQFAVWTRRD